MKLPASILTVARNLGDLRQRMVFVGGMVHELLVTDPAAPPSRPTKDVDVIVDVSSMAEMVFLGESLRERGFREATGEDAHICGWLIEDVPVDVMPVDPAILGFTNVWYPGSLGHATTVDTSAGAIRIIDPAHFCATKFEAYASRGGHDFFHHDLEDVISLIDRRAEIVSDIGAADEDVREYLAQAVAELLADAAFLEALPGHLEGDAASQARLPIVLARLRGIAALRQRPSPSRATPRATKLLPVTGNLPALQILPSRVLVRSSNLRAVAYDGASSVLTIEFQNQTIYEYHGVPATIHAGLVSAASAGRYHHRWIRNSYPYKRLR